LDPDRFLTEVHRLKISYDDDHGIAAYAFRRLYTPLAPAEKHKTWWAAGTGGGTHLHPHIYRHMARVIRSMNLRGIQTNGFYQHHQAELILNNNFWVTPENIISIGPWNQRFPDGVREPCLSDPEFLATDIEQRALEFAEPFRKFQPLGYATAEETSLSVGRPEGTVCTGPHCRRRFVTWLQEAYGDLDALNRQWDTAFTDWQKAEPLRWEDGAADLENPSRWIDFRMFMEEVVARMQRRFNKGILKADPLAYVGFNCAPYGVNPFHGFNRPLLGQITNFSIEYQPSWLEDRGVSTSMELLADSSPQMRLSYWLGYKYMDLDPGRYWFKTWWMAFHQLYGPTLYTLSNDASTVAHYSYIKMHPTLSPNGFTTRTADLTSSLTSGIGKLLMNTDRQVDIGVYFSRASMMRNYVDQARNSDDVSFSVWDVRKLLREEDLDYRRVTRRQLQGKDTDRYRFLLLTDAVALGDEEWDLLERYVADGGTVIAFARTGVADGHGKLRTDHHRAANLLGIRYRTVEPRWTAEPVHGFQAASGMGSVMTPGPVNLEGGAVSATFADGSPAVVVHRAGRGTAVFCNFNARMESSDGNRRLIAALVNTSGDRRAFRVLGNDRAAGGFQSFRYTRGPIELIGLLHTMSSGVEAGAPLTLQTKETAHTYNLLTGDYAGQVSDIAFNAPDRGYPLLFARLAYEVEDVTLTCPVAVEAADETPGDHVFRVEVSDPEGQRVDVLTRNVIARQGRYAGVLPFAYNDPTGEWVLRVRDVISGKSVGQTVSLRGT
jgi:hypothetical protein